MPDIPDTPHISVRGTAEVRVPPDFATVICTIKCVHDDAAVAKDTADRRSQNLITTSKELGIATADVTSSQIAIAPDYTWSDGAKKYNGTSVSREISIVVRDLSKYSPLINLLADLPISALTKVTMDTSRRDETEQEVIRAAVEDARRSANTIAEQLGGKLGPAISIHASVRSFHIAGASREIDRGADAFEPGTIEISHELHATFKLD